MASATTATEPSFWEVYNSEDSLLPLYLPLFLCWIPTYLYCIAFCPKKDAYQRWYLLHNFHNGGAMLLATLSINEWLNERLPILWSLGYFFVDIIDCLLIRDWTYLFHAVCCFVLGMANYHTPILFRLKANSKGTYCELSNPLMHLAKKTRNPIHFAAFAVMFTFCRILWMPVIYRQLLAEGLAWTHPALLVLAVFYGLNVFWYIKILRILINGLRGKSPPTEENGDDKKNKEE